MSLRIRAAWSGFRCCLKIKERRNVRAVPTQHENSEYNTEPAHPRSLIRNSLFVETKMHRNVAALSSPHDNNEYPSEPAHSRSLIWISLSVEKKNVPKRESCPYATWEREREYRFCLFCLERNVYSVEDKILLFLWCVPFILIWGINILNKNGNLKTHFFPSLARPRPPPPPPPPTLPSPPAPSPPGPTPSPFMITSNIQSW